MTADQTTRPTAAQMLNRFDQILRNGGQWRQMRTAVAESGWTPEELREAVAASEMHETYQASLRMYLDLIIKGTAREARQAGAQS